MNQGPVHQAQAKVASKLFYPRVVKIASMNQILQRRKNAVYVTLMKLGTSSNVHMFPLSIGASVTFVPTGLI